MTFEKYWKLLLSLNGKIKKILCCSSLINDLLNAEKNPERIEKMLAVDEADAYIKAADALAKKWESM